MKTINDGGCFEGNKPTESIINFTTEVLSFKRALVFLDMSASTLYKKTHKREIPFFKPNGKLIYFLKIDLINYMLSNKQEAIEKHENQIENYLKRDGHVEK